MKLTALLISLAVISAPFGQDPTKIGGLKFTPPKGWSATGESNSTVAVYAAPDLPSGKVCQVRVFPNEKSSEAFDKWFDRKWSSTVSSKRTLLRTSPPAKEKVGVIEVALRSGAYKEGSGEAYVLLIGLVAEGQSVHLLYESNDYPIWEAHQKEVFDMLDTMTLADSKEPNEKPAPTTRPSPGPSQWQELPPIRTRPRLPAPSSLPAGCPMPAGTPDEAAAILASKVAEYSADSLPALVTALRASGFTIRTPDGKLIAKPLTERCNGIYVEDAELLTYFGMSARGDTVSADGLVKAIDFVLERNDAPFKLANVLPSSLVDGLQSKTPSVKFFARFLTGIGKSLPQHYDLSESQLGKPTRITPLEVFLILRTFTENARAKLRKLQKESDDSAIEQLFPSFGPALVREPNPFEMKGWVEDGVTFVQTTGMSVAFEAGKLENLGNVANGVNFAMAFLKFFATYHCLKVDFSVASPGEPLKRTHAMTANGETRTLAAHVYMDMPKVAQLMKDWRLATNATGIDFDMPKTGDMVGTEVRWRMLGYTTMATVLEKPVQFVGSNPENTVTDAGGVARIDIEGTKQRRVVLANAPPVNSRIPISVMVQVKGIELPQDLVDAASGAFGVTGGGKGEASLLLSVPVVMMEMIYRAKILVNGTMNLKFVDWGVGSLRAAYSVHVSGNGTVGTGLNKTVWSVNRSYIGTGWLVPTENIPEIASALRQKPGAKIMFDFKQGPESWTVADREVRTFNGACLETDKIVGKSTTTFDGPLASPKNPVTNWGRLSYVYYYPTSLMFLDIREPNVDGTKFEQTTMNGKITYTNRSSGPFGLFPYGMSQDVPGIKLGQEIKEGVDPGTLALGESIQGTYSFKQPYKNRGTLTVKYQYVFSPLSDEEGEESLVLPAPQSISSVLAGMQEVWGLAEEEELPTCTPTKLGPLRTLARRTAAKH